MGAFSPYGLLVKDVVLILLEPHELEAPSTATDLRCHNFPRTLSWIFGCLERLLI